MKVRLRDVTRHRLSRLAFVVMVAVASALTMASAPAIGGLDRPSGPTSRLPSLASAGFSIALGGLADTGSTGAVATPSAPAASASSSPGASAAASATAPSAAGSAPAGTSGPGSTPILLYAQDWNGYSSTRSEAAWQQAAVTHQVLVGSPGPVYGGMISRLHGWNPALKVLAYDLGPYTVAGTSDYQTLMAEDPGYFARSANGSLITVQAVNGSPAYPSNTLMDEADPGWQAWQAQRVETEISEWGFDGAYIDSMGPGIFTGTTTAVPLNPSTGQLFTQEQWMTAEEQTLDAIKAAIGSKYLFATGVVNGVEFQDDDTNLLAESAANGVQTDSWMRVSSASLTAWPSPSLLASDLAMVQSLQAEGKSFFAWTKVWTSATPDQVSAWNTYALAAYLLVDNGINDYYTFDSPFQSDRTTIFYPNELASLGAPEGGFILSGGVYTRSFAHGSVSLNTNTDAAAVTVTS